MAGFTLQRGLRDINKFRSRKPDKASSASSACDTSEPRISLGHDNENAIPQQDSGQSNRQEGLFSPPHRSSISNTPERKESNGVHTPSFNPNFCSDHGILKTTSALFAHPKGTPLSTDIIVHEENVDSTPTVALPDGDGGQEEDVEAENECLTISMDKSDRVIPSIPDDNTQDRSSEERLDSNSSIRDRCSGDFERREFDNSRTGGSFSSTRSTTSTTATLSIIDPSHQQGQATTTTVTNNTSLKDFVPSEEWVEAWMKTLRFEPLLMMLHHIVPEIESIQALNDHQVFDHIRSHVIPMLHQCLPEAGRPPIVVHKLAWDKLARWFQTLLWSQVFLGGGGRLGRQGLGAWYDTKVKLFSIQTAAAPVAATRAADNITSKPIVTANADTSSGSSSEAASTIHANEPVILSNAASSSRRAESKT
ncbi:hypothetical protein BCR41DRAFT_361832 [Lobosporangium transversale]|uniref:Uncharacterized protein n=1 Tax=Lobosporangium transversale TaxID=64571 RepID=A0A1Y2GA63_9FUNG|nr:hypothetical protein BCR41DRAFT_361832 [Lobosporangium transversale]ORZ05292.1 hypothetical protein BCR41DRAFT_361832 [Lobosporangium transversale]|eukprot:XP_021876984.1 hypothetical protein BCR41DRAFT_361832 [Lobosporangium transversale]